jgi:diguanylate cyclase (GGDEF)-like protein
MRAKIDDKLAELRALILEAVRAEESVDRLTQLGSGHLLNSIVQTDIDDNTPFWVAFIEVDKFKSINDEFGYDNADSLLRGVATELRHASGQYFSTETTPFRAHGDEFFLVGRRVTGATNYDSTLDLQSEGRPKWDTEASGPLGPADQGAGVHNGWWLYPGYCPHRLGAP